MSYPQPCWRVEAPRRAQMRRSVECEECSVKCGAWRVQCEVWSVKCEVWSVECEVWSVDCEGCSVKCEECGVCSVECADCQLWSVKWSFKCDMWNTTSVSQSARTHGLGWRTAHASSIDEKGVIYIFKATSAPPRAGTTGTWFFNKMKAPQILKCLCFPTGSDLNKWPEITYVWLETCDLISRILAHTETVHTQKVES